MVSAKNAELHRAEHRASFMADALRSHDELMASAKAYDGEEVIAYMRARMRGEKVAKPCLKSIESFHSGISARAAASPRPDPA